MGLVQGIAGFIQRNIGSKTLKLALGTILGAVGGVLADKIDWPQASLLIVQALGFLFLHDQEEKAKAKAE